MILCCGEALIDMLPCEIRPSQLAYVPHPGGASYNTAIALGRLGVPTEVFSGISHDPFGKLLEKTLKDANVGIRYAIRSHRQTKLAFVEFAEGDATYRFYGENSADCMIGEDDLPEFNEGIAALQFGGISLTQEPCGSAYEILMRRQRSNRLILFDPNIRPDFITDKQTHLARMRRMIAMSDIIKVSTDDLAWFGSDDPTAVANDWLASGAKIVIVTAGAGQLSAHYSNGSIQVDVQRSDVVDTVGAGDTFNAGLLASFWRNGLLSKTAIANISAGDLEKALIVGCRAASMTVSRAGANPPWADEINF